MLYCRITERERYTCCDIQLVSWKIPTGIAAKYIQLLNTLSSKLPIDSVSNVPVLFCYSFTNRDHLMAVGNDLSFVLVFSTTLRGYTVLYSVYQEPPKISNVSSCITVERENINSDNDNHRLSVVKFDC